MGERRRERTRDFFSLGWLLDPGRNERREANDLMRESVDRWRAAGEHLPSARDIDQSVRRTAMVSEDRNPTYAMGQEAQRRALAQMQGIADAGGYTDIERGQLRQHQMQAAQHERSQRLAALQQMQSRGMSGSGAELASRLQAQQSGANRMANAATDIGVAAQQRALQAMQAGSDMGNRMSEHQFERGKAINAFNRANAQARGLANQQTYENRLALLDGESGQRNTSAGSMYSQAQQQAQAQQGLINTAVQLAT